MTNWIVKAMPETSWIPHPFCSATVDFCIFRILKFDLFLQKSASTDVLFALLKREASSTAKRMALSELWREMTKE